MNEKKVNNVGDATEQNEKQVVAEQKQAYQAPDVESHKPLEIMSKFEDKSSELVF